MKLIFIILILQFLLSCNNANNIEFSKAQNDTSKVNYDKNSSDKNFSINPNDILKDFMTWYNYTSYNIHLAQDFIGLDTDSSKINKAQFLTRLTTGNFVPFKIRIINNIPIYKLYKLNNNSSDIKATIQQSTLHEIENDKMEGKELPNFNFIDLNGNIYNKATTLRKIIVLKCWFIHCVACVKEFPELNKLVDEYKRDSNILFVSLALDNKNDLISFLKNRQFNYAVIPSSENYMTQSLGIQEYPTHIIVDQTEKIIKVVNTVEDLIPALKKEFNKITHNKSIASGA